MTIFILGCIPNQNLYKHNKYKIDTFQTAVGPFGCIGITSIKFDGIEIKDSIHNKCNGTYSTTSKPLNPAWFYSATEYNIYNYPHIIEITWFIYGEQQLYQAKIDMPDYQRLNEFIKIKPGISIGLGIFFNIPPQIQCYIFESNYHPQNQMPMYTLVAAANGIPIFNTSDMFKKYTINYCKKGILPESVCNKFASYLPNIKNE